MSNKQNVRELNKNPCNFPADFIESNYKFSKREFFSLEYPIGSGNKKCFFSSLIILFTLSKTLKR